MKPLVKTTGSAGAHLYVPIVRGPTQKQVWTFAKALAQALADQHPKLLTAEYRIAARPKGRVLVDYNQNAKDRTMAAAYSVRPTDDARVSAPISWQELDTCEPGDFTLATMPKRYAKLGDRHAAMDDHAGSLESLLELSARHEREGMGDAPWPPQYRKAAG